jgi:hypothetical protein
MLNMNFNSGLSSSATSGLSDSALSAPSNYIDYRCVNPGSVVSQGPWFPMTDVCPCEPNLSNPSGRGIVACPFGINGSSLASNGSSNELSNRPQRVPLSTIKYSDGSWTPVQMKQSDLPFGSMFSTGNYIPPQLEPRPLVKIGVTWRS